MKHYHCQSKTISLDVIAETPAEALELARLRGYPCHWATSCEKADVGDHALVVIEPE